MRTKLPTIKVNSCFFCPFRLEVFDESSVHSTPRCAWPSENNDFADELREIELSRRSPNFPDWCPGKQYDISVEFPDE